MWPLHRTQNGLSALLLAATMVPVAAHADEYVINQNQTGITLPGVVMPNGFDEVRAADGTICRSSMAGSGPYLDSGLLGGGLNDSANTISAYGRIVVPLGKQPPRLDCDRLYRLELERLQLEVQLLKRGLDPRTSTAVSNDAEWAKDDAWTTGDRK